MPYSLLSYFSYAVVITAKLKKNRSFDICNQQLKQSESLWISMQFKSKV